MRDSSYRRVREISLHESFERFANGYLTRCLVDRKYLVRYVQIVFGASSHCSLRRAITHDPDVYPEPDAFRPERFLNPNGTLRDDDTLRSVFGFGKRVCPGRHYVDATLFIVAATVLSVFRIEMPCDAEGASFGFSYSGSLVRCVECFPSEHRGLIVIIFQSSEPVPMLDQSKG